MKKLRFVGALSLMLISVSACSSGPPDLPDRASPSVKAEEARLAVLLGADTSIVDAPGVCKVRLLGQEAGVSFVWALCQAVPPATTGVSAPFRVSGSKVTKTQLGDYEGGVRKMFPEDLADFVIDNPSSPELRP